MARCWLRSNDFPLLRQRDIYPTRANRSIPLPVGSQAMQAWARRGFLRHIVDTPDPLSPGTPKSEVPEEQVWDCGSPGTKFEAA